jgi:GPH family glycoside/pentoside/hexuronide:cation symporter
MSSDFHERTRIMAVAQWIGQWAWVISPWFWVIIYRPEWFESPAAGCRQLAIWVGLICMGFALVPGLFIKSKSTIDADHLQDLSRKNLKSNVGKFFRGFADAFRNTEFRRLCIATFFIFNSFNTIAAFSFFIIVYYLFGGDAGAAGFWPTLHGSVGALVTTFIVIPTVSKVSQKIGKKKTFMISQSISIIGYALFWFLFVPGRPYLYLIALPFFSFGIGGLFTLMMSMTADVCDLDEYNTGMRREGIFGAIFWWMVKFGFAIAGLLSGAIMALVGFTPDAAVQPAGAITGMRIFYSVLPIAGTIGALLVMRSYGLSEKRANEIRAVLEERHSVNNAV